jgi:hypothetical protein
MQYETSILPHQLLMEVPTIVWNVYGAVNMYRESIHFSGKTRVRKIQSHERSILKVARDGEFL